MTHGPETREGKQNCRELRRNKELLATLHKETDYQRADFSLRAGAMATRGSILIAAASISSALQYGQQGFWFLAAVWLSVISAALGAVVLLPRLGSHLGIEENEGDLWGQNPTQAKRDLMYQKLRILRQDEKALLWRRRVLLAGYSALALSLAVTAIHLSINIVSGSEPNAPEEVSSSTPTPGASEPYRSGREGI